VKKIKFIHIAIIVLGSIFCLLPAFHTNLWFDESYSVAIAEHGFLDIWQITGNDVHPALYYWILHVIYLVFGNNIIAFRLCSVVGLVVLGIVGYTHVRKDFGEKTGLLFSFLVFFFPTMLMYATEIRMYTWAMLFVTLMCIYAYRIYKKQTQWKNWVIFGGMALCAAYTHYYGLVTAGVVNAMLFFYLLINCIKQKQFLKEMKAFILTAIVEIGGYLPWLVYLALQVSQVSKGFWIGFVFPDSIIDLFIFQFTGNIGNSGHIAPVISTVFASTIGICFITYMIKHWKEEEAKPAKLAILMYFIVIAVIVVLSLIMTPILYPRYLLVITGPLWIAMAFAFSKIRNSYVKIVLSVLLIEIAIYANISLIQYNYDETNEAPMAYLQEHIQEGDILLCKNEGSGFVTFSQFPGNAQYFWDEEKWNVEKAYRAFGHMQTIENLDVLDTYEGRIWTVNAYNYYLVDKMQERYGDKIQVLEKQSFDVKYQQCQYRFALLEKDA